MKTEFIFFHASDVEKLFDESPDGLAPSWTSGQLIDWESEGFLARVKAETLSASEAEARFGSCASDLNVPIRDGTLLAAANEESATSDDVEDILFNGFVDASCPPEAIVEVAQSARRRELLTARRDARDEIELVGDKARAIVRLLGTRGLGIGSIPVGESRALDFRGVRIWAI